jgi:hypothetical protein
MHVKKLSSWTFIHIIFIISLITFSPPLNNDIAIDYNFNIVEWTFMDYLFTQNWSPLPCNHLSNL